MHPLWRLTPTPTHWRLPLPPLPRYQVAIYISPHQVQSGDRGLVVVGASVERGDLASAEGSEGGFDNADVLRREMRQEEETRHHTKSAGWG